jgi:hypothetical protein
MRVFYTPRYYADIGEGHVFPIRKSIIVKKIFENQQEPVSEGVYRVGA